MVTAEQKVLPHLSSGIAATQFGPGASFCPVVRPQTPVADARRQMQPPGDRAKTEQPPFTQDEEGCHFYPASVDWRRSVD